MLIIRRTVDEAIESAPGPHKNHGRYKFVGHRNFKKFYIKILTRIGDKGLKKNFLTILDFCEILSKPNFSLTRSA